MNPRSERKPDFGQRSTSKKHATLMSSKTEPVIWSCDTGQRISCYDSCQLNIIGMFNIKDICCNPRLHDLVLAGWPPCCVTSFVVVIIRARNPRVTPLAILTIRKELHGFLFLCIRVVPFSIIMGLRCRRSSAITCSKLKIKFPDFSTTLNRDLETP